MENKYKKSYSRRARTMSTSYAQQNHDEPPLETLILGDDLVHTFQIICHEKSVLPSKLLSCLAKCSCIRTLREMHIGVIVNYQVRLSGISEQQARAIRARIMRFQRVLRVRLEHQIKLA
jgi:hypothetical protein